MTPTKPPTPRPCASCPYRQDTPSGIWEPGEYDKLPRYDAETFAQPPLLFLCHQHDPGDTHRRICGGWLACHGPYNLLAVRLAIAEGRISDTDIPAVAEYSTPVPLFASGVDAAAHGRTETDTPSPAANTAIRKIKQRRASSPR